MRIGLAPGRDAFITRLEQLLSVVERLDDHELLAASRCHGWPVADLAGGALGALADDRAVLIGTGRQAVPGDLDLAGLQLPAFG